MYIYNYSFNFEKLCPITVEVMTKIFIIIFKNTCTT